MSNKILQITKLSDGMITIEIINHYKDNVSATSTITVPSIALQNILGSIRYLSKVGDMLTVEEQQHDIVT